MITIGTRVMTAQGEPGIVVQAGQRPVVTGTVVWLDNGRIVWVRTNTLTSNEERTRISL